MLARFPETSRFQIVGYHLGIHRRETQHAGQAWMAASDRRPPNAYRGSNTKTRIPFPAEWSL